MIFLEPADVVLVATRVSGGTIDETLAGADLDSVQRILEEARGSDQGQSPSSIPPHPSGASGYHRIVITVGG